MIKTFTELEALTDESTTTDNEFKGKLPEIILSGRQQEATIYQVQLAALGKRVQAASQKLFDQMRAELREI